MHQGGLITKMINNSIPPMINPLGKHWDQPSNSNILVDDTHAIMGGSDFEKLKNYSRSVPSVPSGVYEGKMWKLQQGEEWFLMWFGEIEDRGVCSLNHRIILLVA